MTERDILELIYNSTGDGEYRPVDSVSNESAIEEVFALFLAGLVNQTWDRENLGSAKDRDRLLAVASALEDIEGLMQVAARALRREAFDMDSDFLAATDPDDIGLAN
jgi:hypothetical protein